MYVCLICDEGNGGGEGGGGLVNVVGEAQERVILGGFSIFFPIMYYLYCKGVCSKFL